MEKRGSQKTLTGIVVSDKMEKSVVVSVERLVKHPVYQKYILRKTKFMAHDEGNESRIGDRVLLLEMRPLSKQKRFKVSKVLEKMEL
jgi:small subunit ribosomal protein S17